LEFVPVAKSLSIPSVWRWSPGLPAALSVRRLPTAARHLRAASSKHLWLSLP